ncbi:hypothetical protein R3P38DRAFT_1330347 [Favolaschia claudopus]|uniref:Uncharacterized protein n=1 Tax=Favolaschia claudopus TaxID=2862362 RepID=A0AAW0AWJ2_9AGAR
MPRPLICSDLRLEFLLPSLLPLFHTPPSAHSVLAHTESASSLSTHRLRLPQGPVHQTASGFGIATSSSAGIRLYVQNLQCAAWVGDLLSEVTFDSTGLHSLCRPAPLEQAASLLASPRHYPSRRARRSPLRTRSISYAAVYSVVLTSLHPSLLICCRLGLYTQLFFTDSTLPLVLRDRPIILLTSLPFRLIGTCTHPFDFSSELPS